MADRQARIGVVGVGWWATYTHLPAIQGHPDANLVAIADRNEQRLQQAVERFNVRRAYADYRAMIDVEELDGLVVAVNHNAHYEVARYALERGLHLMIEKPMVLEARHGAELLALAAQQRREIIVGYPWHYTTLAAQARSLVQSGQLGEIQFVSSLFASMVIEFYRGNPEAYRPVFQYPVTGPSERSYSDARLAGGGQGHLQITHSAGLMFFVTGLRARRVSGFMANFDVPVDLVDGIGIQFDNGAIGVVGSTGNLGVGDPGQHDLRVYGTRGYVLLEMNQGTLGLRYHDGREEHIGPIPPDDRYPRFATATNLIDVILGRDVNRSPGIVGQRTVEFLEAAYRSAADGGRPIEVS
ncbi:MAG: Gfo/Idh/MocA family oxidoreductase [Chloroflexi bacterium]|nr:Gfo/Idh/MocA family oxidoreductase [Chloroflexota bacterium]